MPLYDFNHTNYHELPLDYIMKLARESMGLELKVVGDKLNLVNDLGATLSSVTISYATAALNDVAGREIRTYLISAGTDSNALIFTNGKGEVEYITPPFATKSEKDINNRNIVDYVYNVSIAGDKLRITDGDQAIVDLTLPFATKAATDINSKDLTSYAASLTVNGNNIELRDAQNRLLNSITVPYATAAASAADALHADDADHADTATVATDATNAVESVAISGDTMVFTTFGGTAYTRTCPYAVRATLDGLSNEITETYVANITNLNGAFQFYDAKGNLLVELVTTVDKAVHDSYNNLIADYIKSISVQSGSNYVTVVHGTGTTETLVIQYSETALKDSQGSVIKNTYVTELECVEDVNDGHFKLVWYNNDNPRSEIGRCDIKAWMAQVDINEKPLTSYLANVDINANNNPIFLDGEGNEVAGISGSVTSTPAGTVSVSLTSGTLPSASYDSGTQTLTFNPGAFPTVDSASFSGTQATNPVVFAQ